MIENIVSFLILEEPISSSNRDYNSFLFQSRLQGTLFLTLVLSLFSVMAEGIRFTRIDDVSLNEFRKETETQIRDLNNTITRFKHIVDQRMEERSDHLRHTEDIQP